MGALCAPEWAAGIADGSLIDVSADMDDVASVSDAVWPDGAQVGFKRPFL